jgi:serine/threonine-protein kinase
MSVPEHAPTPEETAAPLASPPGDPALAETAAAVISGEQPTGRRALPPSLLARYEDVALLGEGGMGVVYRGRDPRLGRTVALKLIKGEDPEQWRRFIQEARAQARVQHEHVCRVYEAGQADGEPYIVMQLIDGEPLSRLRDRLTLEQGIALMRDVALAVHEAHRLGLVHRDLKPHNVMVEQGEDGALKPYVMDFGLAREVAERGQTMTGAVVGTPAYMPPEQALGDLRALDRRSDVYALGATLYDLIAGRPPFVDEHPWKLLMKVAYEDAPPLGSVKKGVPGDVETIVMKCLEHAPGRRYDSARALAEDLGRFLDGDPIQARRASLGYVAWKKARKHKLATALGAAVVVAALSLGGVWAKGKRDAAEQARLAQALGEDVKGMELFLRNAYGMPLHDVERERDLVRGRLSRIEANMKAAGRVGEGPGHYAMGRGHLVLGDPAAARAHLEKARAAGYASAALDNALGQALGELFRRAIEESKRISNEAERKKKVAALEVELRDPALARLRAAVGADGEAPAYAEGLIALYEGKNEEALRKAREAFAAAPWLYEAKKLEGDAQYALGSPFRHDAAFDWEKMMAHFQPAAEAYRAAADLARSDPEVHRAECELWEKIGWAALTRDRKDRAAFDPAEAACARAVAASHADTRARVQRALVLSARLSWLHGDDGEGVLIAADEAVGAAEDAARRAPEDVMARYALASALYEQGRLRAGLGRDITVEPIVAAYQRVVELDPRFTWAISELGEAYLLAYDTARTHGREDRAALESAAREFDRAARLDPAFSLPAQKKVKAYNSLLEDDIERGVSAEATVAVLFDALAAVEQRLGPSAWIVTFLKAWALRLRAAHELSLGHDPLPLVAASLQTAGGSSGAVGDDHWLLLEIAQARIVEATHALRAGLPVAPPVAAARLALQGAGRGGAIDDRWRCLTARVELLIIREAERSGGARPEQFDAALQHLHPTMTQGTVEAEPYQIVAELHARRALRLARRHEDGAADVAAARARAAEALARDPHRATALVAQALAALAEGIATRHPAEGARQAQAKLDAAFRENPRLAPDFAAEAKEIAGMAK